MEKKDRKPAPFKYIKVLVLKIVYTCCTRNYGNVNKWEKILYKKQYWLLFYIFKSIFDRHIKVGRYSYKLSNWRSIWVLCTSSYEKKV